MRAGVEEIARAGERATGLTRQRLAFSRLQTSEARVLALDEVVAGMEKMLGRLLGEDIELAVCTGSSVGRVLADPSQIEQIVMNLAVNARDTMPRSGRLRIELHDISFDEAFAGERGIELGPYVMLTVTDTGCGMDAVIRERIFEPFFRPRRSEKEPGSGSPRSSASSSRAEGTSKWTPIRGAGRPSVFHSCAWRTAKIHLLLTDVVMPRMNGHELAQRLRVPYVSGHPESTVVRRSVLGEGHALLQKPVTPGALLRKVREVLDASPAPPSTAPDRAP